MRYIVSVFGCHLDLYDGLHKKILQSLQSMFVKAHDYTPLYLYIDAKNVSH